MGKGQTLLKPHDIWEGASQSVQLWLLAYGTQFKK
jgi:hypothetical protein